MKAYKFTVRGAGAFPIDLMRQELCWPNSVNDSRLIGRLITSTTNHGLEGREMISLTGLKMPSTILWRNNSYYVIKVESTNLRNLGV